MRNYIHKLHEQAEEAEKNEEDQEIKWQLRLLVDSIRFNLHQIKALNGEPVPPTIIEEVAELSNIFERLTK